MESTKICKNCKKSFTFQYLQLEKQINRTYCSNICRLKKRKEINEKNKLFWEKVKQEKKENTKYLWDIK